MESICGKFIAMSRGLNQRTPLVDGRLSSVCFKLESPFGLQTDHPHYHVSGHLRYRASPGAASVYVLQGVWGVAGLGSQMGDMMFEDLVKP